ARKPRYSVPFFLHPNPDVVLDPGAEVEVPVDPTYEHALLSLDDGADAGAAEAVHATCTRADIVSLWAIISVICWARALSGPTAAVICVETSARHWLAITCRVVICCSCCRPNVAAISACTSASPARAASISSLASAIWRVTRSLRPSRRSPVSIFTASMVGASRSVTAHAPASRPTACTRSDRATGCTTTESEGAVKLPIVCHVTRPS
ncbi:MAG: hypothetical protein B7Y77_02335, partial [Bradyrhizobium sp. 35-63-5]